MVCSAGAAADRGRWIPPARLPASNEQSVTCCLVIERPGVPIIPTKSKENWWLDSSLAAA